MKELERLSDEIKELKILVVENQMKTQRLVEELKKLHVSHRTTISQINSRLKNMIFRGVRFD